MTVEKNIDWILIGQFDIENYSVSIHGTATSEYVEIDYMNNDNYDSGIIESWIDDYDLNNLKEFVTQTLKEYSLLK